MTSKEFQNLKPGDLIVINSRKDSSVDYDEVVTVVSPEKYTGYQYIPMRILNSKSELRQLHLYYHELSLI